MKNSVCMSLLWLLGMAGVNVHAMGFFDKEAKLRQTELSVAELQQLSIQSGWSNDEPDLMMFEVGNKLSGPIFCIGASFEFKGGQKRNQAFEPKLYIPPNATRRVSVRGIEKKKCEELQHELPVHESPCTGPL
jgi:hypothetical protein